MGKWKGLYSFFLFLTSTFPSVSTLYTLPTGTSASPTMAPTPRTAAPRGMPPRAPSTWRVSLDWRGLLCSDLPSRSSHLIYSPLHTHHTRIIIPYITSAHYITYSYHTRHRRVQDPRRWPCPLQADVYRVPNELPRHRAVCSVVLYWNTVFPQARVRLSGIL